MKSHTLIGEKILSAMDSKIMKLATGIARSHHENWNGGGYPDGLIGKHIPAAGRLTALADVFDALLSERPYKKTWDFESAVRYVEEESGEKFDPDIVAAFKKNIEKVRLIYHGVPM